MKMHNEMNGGAIRYYIGFGKVLARGAVMQSEVMLDCSSI
jgi:hypothetical protein